MVRERLEKIGVTMTTKVNAKEHLKSLLKAKGTTISISMITHILAERGSAGPQKAKALAEVFGTDAEPWRMVIEPGWRFLTFKAWAETLGMPLDLSRGRPMKLGSTPQSGWLNKGEAAQYCNMHRDTLRKHWPNIRTGFNGTRTKREYLDEYMLSLQDNPLEELTKARMEQAVRDIKGMFRKK